MPKKIFAVTNVKVGNGEGQSFAAGSEVDPKQFTKEQLVALHDQGAIEVRTVDEQPEAEQQTEESEETAETQETQETQEKTQETEENPPPAE